MINIRDVLSLEEDTVTPSATAAISCDQRWVTPTGPARADELARSAPRKGGQRLSVGESPVV